MPGWDAHGSHAGDPGYEHDTIATIPLSQYGQSNTQKTNGAFLNGQDESQTDHVTQPTQILPESPESRQARSVVEVPRSSPPPFTSPHQPSRPLPPANVKSVGQHNLASGGRLASVMAPPGTAFRSPYVQAQARQSQSQSQSRQVDNTQQSQYTQDSDDDLARFWSSDEETSRPSANIKPTVFARGGQPINSPKQALSGPARPTPAFQSPLDLLSRFAFNTTNPNLKRGSDAMAPGSNASRPAKVSRQQEPAKASVPVQKELKLDDIQDWVVRQNIEKMLDVMPDASVAKCQKALQRRAGNLQDALALLTDEQDTAEDKSQNAIDLTHSDDDQQSKRSFKRPLTKNTQQDFKRGLEKKTTITGKYSSAAALAKQNIKDGPPSPVRKPATTNTTSTSSNAAPTPATVPAEPKSPVAETPPKPRRRLMQGRRDRTASPESPDPIIVAPATKPTTIPQLKQRSAKPIAIDSDESDASDSGVEIEDTSKDGSEQRLLKFINKSTLNELLELSHQPRENVEIILAKRPFSSLTEIEQVTVETTVQYKTGKSRQKKKAIGESLVKVCSEIWRGYEAVDQLVADCERIGKPIAETMKGWGIDLFSNASSADLQIMELGQKPSHVHDSGIGTPVSSEVSGDEQEKASSSKKSTFLKQPALMNPDMTMKNYQVAGLNWLALLFSHRLSCILADDMGLGKTCQVISFIAHLFEIGVKGPHLIVVPGSTLENWLREFRLFCPSLAVEPYYGDQKIRSELRYQFLENTEDVNVIVTTYEIAVSTKDDRSFLRKLSPTVCVYDEGHALKNNTSKRYGALMKIEAEFKLLLTGTPLQNNLKELVSLLAFIMPGMFHDKGEDMAAIFSARAKTTDSEHKELLSAQRISRARSMMKPFILRRKKYQVLKQLPKKTSRIEYCDMEPEQKEIYDEQLARVKEGFSENANGEGKVHTNLLMDLRKAAIHPLLFRNLYTDDIIQEMAKACIKEDDLKKRDVEWHFEEFAFMSDYALHRICLSYPRTLKGYQLEGTPWLDSGKVSKLVKLIKDFRANGDRVLVFSQFTMVMDILESVFQTHSIDFSRLDGNTKVDDRQGLIDQFYTDKSITVFMVSTKAGGTGINLVCANKVVIFDSSFNPQEDIQAENRAHRVGQTRDVEVVRLVTRGTIEEKILKLGESKLAMDARVAGAEGEGDGDGDGEGNGDMEEGEGESDPDGGDGSGSGTGGSGAAKEKRAAELVGKMLFDDTFGGSSAAVPTSTSASASASASASGKHSGTGKDGKDIKDEYMQGLKKAGLDMSAAAR